MMLSLRAERTLDKLCNTWEVRPVGYKDTPLGRVYLAEGWQARRPNRDGTDEGPGWTILWAILHKGVNMARAMYVRGRTQDGRIGLALKDATEFLEQYHRGKEAKAQSAAN